MKKFKITSTYTFETEVFANTKDEAWEKAESQLYDVCYGGGNVTTIGPSDFDEPEIEEINNE